MESKLCNAWNPTSYNRFQGVEPETHASIWVSQEVLEFRYIRLKFQWIKQNFGNHCFKRISSLQDKTGKNEICLNGIETLEGILIGAIELESECNLEFKLNRFAGGD